MCPPEEKGDKEKNQDDLSGDTRSTYCKGYEKRLRFELLLWERDIFLRENFLTRISFRV